MTKVLVVATSRKTRGGIASVVKAHKTGEQWGKFHCKWIETHRDGNVVRKLWYICMALIEYTFLLPFCGIVHIHIATPPSAKRKVLFFYPAKWLGKKVILHFHPSNEKFLFEPANCKLYRRLFSKADLVLVLSEQWKYWIKMVLGLDEHIEVLYNPCPIVNRREDLRKKHVLFAGTIIPRKGYEILIRGFAKIAQKYPDWNVVFAGNGEIENAMKIADCCGIKNQVKFLGWVTGEDKERVFQEASVYCLASDGEGFPMGVLDAWAYGVPCVVTPVGGIPDIIVDGENGLVFNVGDVNGLAGKLQKIISDRTLRESIVTKQDEYVKETFNVNSINKRLEEIYIGLSE